MIAVVSHDAGGAQVISSWILNQAEPFCLVVDGPAIEIFKNKLSSFENIELITAINKCDWVLCGTSWQSDLEINAIKIASKLGKKTVSLLDHWVCYKERFVRASEQVIPDEIWVNDPYAKKIAIDIFPEIKIIENKNYYLEDLKKTLVSNEGKVSKSERIGKTVLYICEPLSEQAFKQYGDERYWGYTEHEALYYFLLNKELVDPNINKIILRLHPAEIKGKYDCIISQHHLTMQVGTQSLSTEIMQSDIIVGCESMAMVVGLIAGKRVVSCIPPGGKPSELPHKEIENLQEFLVNISTAKHAE
jgi:hypothetical protein